MNPVRSYLILRSTYYVVMLIAAASVTYDIHQVAKHSSNTVFSVRKPVAQDNGTHMPDSMLTPGKWDPHLTAEEVCVRGSAGDRRNVTEAMKRQVYLRYGINSHKPGEYEIDHLVSLELGGQNDIENLWPQKYNGEWNAHMKDKLENKLHQMVCRGDIKLETAQEEIRTDWVEAYEKYISN